MGSFDHRALRAWRKGRKLTQEQAAQLFHATRRAVQTWEAGLHEPVPATRERLEAAIRGDLAPTQTPDGWRLVPAGEAPPTAAYPPPQDDLAPIRAAAARFGLVLAEPLEIGARPLEGGSTLTHVSIGPTSVLEVEVRLDGSIGLRRTIPRAGSLLDMPPNRYTAPSSLLFSAPMLTGQNGRPTLGDVLSFLETQRVGHDPRPLGEFVRIEAKIPVDEAEALKRAAWKRRVTVAELFRALARAARKEEEAAADR